MKSYEERLIASGIDLKDLENRLEQILIEGPHRYTRDQLTAAGQLPSDEVIRLWSDLGFPALQEDSTFSQSDISAMRSLDFLVNHQLLDANARASVGRAVGQVMSRLADLQSQVVADLLLSEQGPLATPNEVVAFVEAIVPVLEGLQNYVWRQHLRQYATRLFANARRDPSTRQTVVGFADMCGYVTLTRTLSHAQLSEVLDGFEEFVSRVVLSHDGRIVKTIGDEVLFITDTAEDAIDIALDLVTRPTAHPNLPGLRVGLAAGPVVRRLGDVFGDVVNVASRLTSLATSGVVLVDRDLAHLLRRHDAVVLHEQPPANVSGYSRLLSWRVSRTEWPADAKTSSEVST